ncbi:MAG: nitrilase [Betaproteobacteria bacterium]|nr:nitrilase [Betaproteobacteria bacterium]
MYPVYNFEMTNFKQYTDGKPMNSKHSTVAVVQAAPEPDKQAAIERIGQLSHEAAAKGAQLLMFPEAFIGGYPRGSGFGTVVGQRTDEGREEFRRYFEAAIDLPGPECAALGEIAAREKLYLVVGVIERDGGTLYCTVVFFAPDGAYMGKHRKLMPTGAERLIWGFGDGSTMPVFDTPIGKLGAVICWENYMPLMRAAHYAKGIQIYCAPTADGRDTWLPTMRHVAMEGRCFVLSCNQFARRSHYPEAFGPLAPGEEDTIVSRGGSCIIDPMGKVLAGPEFDGEKILYADIDIGSIAGGKYDFDATGHYARPDVFRLLVNQSAAPAVVFSDQSTFESISK